jgi:hypothetical protein
VVFDGVEQLDALGPYEVFSVARQAGADLEVRLVTYKDQVVDRIRAAHGLVFHPKAGSMKTPTSWLSREEGGVAEPTGEPGRLPRKAPSRSSSPDSTDAAR